MKIFLLFILVVMIMLIAKGVANQYKERNKFFVSVMSFLNMYELNIGFKKEKIKDLIEKLNVNGSAKILFSRYNDFLSTNANLNLEEIKILTDEEKDFISNTFKSIGTSDYSNEMTQLKVFKGYIQEKIDLTSKDSSKNYPLIIKLSFLFSLGLALIFI